MAIRCDSEARSDGSIWGLGPQDALELGIGLLEENMLTLHVLGILGSCSGY